MIDTIVIGGGPAGMGAALSASKENAKVLLIERNNVLGGILNQCIHNGFGLHYFGEELTGPEYAERFVKLVNKDKNIQVMLDTFVTKISKKQIEIINPLGKKSLKYKSLVLAMGCRERTQGNILLTGTRPAGIYTAGLAQRMVNIEGKLPGKKIVILGSGDIGLIMARRLTYEGAKVLCVLEINKNTSGLKRNIAQCLNDYNIPLYTSTTIFEVVGNERVKGIYYGKVDDNYNRIEESKKFLECDCIILSVGLIPETDLLENVDINKKTNSVFVDDTLSCLLGVYACGNFLHVHDLVDNVTQEAIDAGKNAALFALNKLSKRNETVSIATSDDVSYTVPNKVYLGTGSFTLKFRVKKRVTKQKIVVYSGDKKIFEKFVMAINPGEMQTININRELVCDKLFLCIE